MKIKRHSGRTSRGEKLSDIRINGVFGAAWNTQRMVFLKMGQTQVVQIEILDLLLAVCERQKLFSIFIQSISLRKRDLCTGSALYQEAFKGQCAVYGSGGTYGDQPEV